MSTMSTYSTEVPSSIIVLMAPAKTLAMAVQANLWIINTILSADFRLASRKSALIFMLFPPEDSQHLTNTIHVEHHLLNILNIH